jgi:hypothetical protein
VPVLRFTRDKRGYEYFYLVEMAPGRRGRTRPRVLFWFRTPPNVKVGREPFSDEVRRALEAKYPDLVFDWKKLSATPAPPAADPERWRERRRAERVARQAAVDADSDVTRDEEPDAPGPPDEPAHDQPAPVVSTPDRDAANLDHETRNPNHAATDPGREAALNVQQDTPAGEPASQSALEAVRRKRRRRRGRRSGSASASGDGHQSTAATPPVDSSEDKV